MKPGNLIREHSISPKPVLRRAFTMIELIVVVILIGFIAGVAMVSVAGPLAKLKLDGCVQKFVQLETQQRRAAQDQSIQGRVLLKSSTELRFECCGRSFALTDGVQIGRMIGFVPGRGWRDCSTVNYIPSGRSPSFAVRFETESGQGRWMLVLGMTGHVIAVQDEQQLSRLMEATAR